MLVDTVLITERILSFSSVELGLFLGALFAVLIYFTSYTNGENQISQTKYQLPGPKQYPVIGNAYALLSHRFTNYHYIVSKLVAKYGGVVGIRIFNYSFVYLASAKYFEKILSSNQHSDKSRHYNALKPWLGNGLNLTKSNEWILKRKLLAPGYQYRFFSNNLLDVANNQSVIMKNILKMECQDEEKVDLLPYIQRCTFDIIHELAMGMNPNTQTQKDSQYFKAFSLALDLVFKRIITPWLQRDFIWNISPGGRAQRKCLRILDDFVVNAINHRKRLLKENESPIEEQCSNKLCSTYVDFLLTTSQGGIVLNDTQIREETSVFLFGGETTGPTIMWTLYFLAFHSEIQDKVHDELDVIFQGDRERQATTNDVAQMKYLDLCIKEALRLCPPGPIITREICQDTDLGDQLIIPAGSFAVLSILELHRDPYVFPDPLKYDPERFLPENCISRHPYAYVPFSAGPRNCPGMKIGQMNIKVILSTLLRNYRFSTTQKMEDLRLSPMLKPLNGPYFTVTSRAEL